MCGSQGVKQGLAGHFQAFVLHTSLPFVLALLLSCLPVTLGCSWRSLSQFHSSKPHCSSETGSGEREEESGWGVAGKTEDLGFGQNWLLVDVHQ